MWSDAARAAAAEARRGKSSGYVTVGIQRVPRAVYAEQLRAARAKLRGKRGFAISSKNRLSREAVHKRYYAKKPGGQSAEMNHRLNMDRWQKS